MIRLEFREGFVQQGIAVLQPVGFVHKKDCPIERPQVFLVLQYDLIRGQQCVELESCFAVPFLLSYLQRKRMFMKRGIKISRKSHNRDTYRVPRDYITEIRDDVHIWSPLLDLPLPRCNRRQRNDEEKWPVDRQSMEQVV